MASPLDVLKKYWGHTQFKGLQEPIIENIIQKNDVLALLPTGGGKSICFQIPALLNEGICVVVSPLVALIQDQVESLKQKGLKAVGLTRGIPPNQLDALLDNCIYGNYKFLYLSPERLQQPLVQERIKKMPVNLIAIDEAHCISEWGHDFRPAYRQCEVLKTWHTNVPLIALTATATQRVAGDILDNLGIPHSLVIKDSFKRTNIHFNIKRKEDKRYTVNTILEKCKKSAIIYVRSRKETVLLSKQLNQSRMTSNFFHGGLTSFEKKDRLSDWLTNEFKIMVATNAFGMGVDKADVDTVVHYNLPDSIENYYQEAGRGGRNGAQAQAVMLVNENDIERAISQFYNSLPDLSYIKSIYKKLMGFFQIAYNEGKDESFNFELNAFCNAYGLYPSKVYTTLKILDQNGIISLSEMSKELNSIQLVSKKDELFGWLKKYKGMAGVVQTLLRTYGGVFEFETKINLTLLAKKSNQKERFVDQTLKQLAKDGLAHYNSETQDVQIMFLTPREDDKTVYPIAENIEKLIQTKKEKFKAMLHYAHNTKKCRTNMLLDYFGEKAGEPCGTCDICISKLVHKTSLKELKQEIRDALKIDDKSSRQLANETNQSEMELLYAIRELLEDGEIRLKGKNSYGI